MKAVFLDCSGVFLDGPVQALGVPPCLWRLCLALFLLVQASLPGAGS